MKWKDNLIYEFINQIISLKWILKPETLWWLNKRGKVFSFPCVEKLYFCNVVWPRQWNTRVQSAPRPRAGPTVTWAMGENCSPQVSAQVFWTLEALKDPVFLLRPSWWHSTEEATQGALSSSLTDTKRRTKGVIPGLSLGPFFQSIQTLTPGSSMAMWTWSLGSTRGVWICGLSSSAS